MCHLGIFCIGCVVCGFPSDNTIPRHDNIPLQRDGDRQNRHSCDALDRSLRHQAMFRHHLHQSPSLLHYVGMLLLLSMLTLLVVSTQPGSMTWSNNSNVMQHYSIIVKYRIMTMFVF